MEPNLRHSISRLGRRVKKLEILSHEPKNYKEECERMQKELDALRTMVYKIFDNDNQADKEE